jgi:hemerythrin
VIEVKLELAMSRIEWDESFSVQNTEMDAQHKKWIEIYNRLHEILISGTTEEINTITAETLQAMQQYTHIHFKSEEEYMNRIQYPDLVQHRRIHKDFENQIYTYNREIAAGQIVLNSRIVKTLKNWLLTHIIDEDQKYRRFSDANTAS